MTENLEALAPAARGRAMNQGRAGSAAAGASVADLESRATHARLRIDEHGLHEAARACAYDARAVSRHFGISIRHLQRWFNAHLASTPCVWLSEQRLQHARRLLAKSGTVKEVAYSLGFNHVSQFSRDFKRRFGHQPSVELERTRLARPPNPVQPSAGRARWHERTSCCDRQAHEARAHERDMLEGLTAMAHDH